MKRLIVSNLFTPLLISVCTGMAQYQAACQKSTEAFFVQSGWESTTTQFQNGATSYGKTQENSNLGSNAVILNTTAAAAIAYKEKKLNLNLPNLGVCDKFSTQLDSNTYKLLWEWKW
jgi:hypothetical protein